MNVMESTKTQLEWSKVAEVGLEYKTKVKASESPLIRNSRDCMKLS